MFPGGTVLAFSLDMTPNGKTIVGQSGIFPFSNGFVLEMGGLDKYGSDAGGANVFDLSASGSNKIGNMLTLTTTNIPVATTQCITIVSAAPAELATLGGTFLVDLTQSLKPLFVEPAAGGSSSFSVTVPNDPGIVGLVAYVQSIANDPSQSKGFAFSNGLRVVVCD